MLGEPCLVIGENLICTTKTLIITATLVLFIGGLVVASSKLAIDLSLSQIRTITTQNWAPQYGNLTLSATVISENEVVLNATFSGTVYVNQPGFIWVLSFSNSSVPGYRNLPEGLELEEGAAVINNLCPVPDRILSLQAKLRAIADGKWVIYGKFTASSGPGFVMSSSTEGIEITVSNGRIVQLAKAPYPYPPSSPTPPSGSQNEHPTSLPISPQHQ
jgi:hypothetical protein